MNEFDTAFYKIVGRKLRELRMQNRFTLDFLAEKIGVTIKTVQRYEVGERKIDANKLRKMVEAIDGDYDKFIASVQAEQSGKAAKPTLVSKSGPSTDELRLLNLYDSLNSEGQEKLIDYADDMVQSGKYETRAQQNAFIDAAARAGAVDNVPYISQPEIDDIGDGDPIP